MQPVRVRFAPSPSGDLHVGGARTALFNWLCARKSGGRYIFRIEDSDAERSEEASVRAIGEALGWLGLEADEGEGPGGPHAPYRQSLALGLYRAQAEQLLQAGRAYWCYDSEAEQEAERERLLQHADERKRRHPHRDLDQAGRARLEAEGRRPSLRFATDDLAGSREWEDLVRGPIRVDLAEIRDFNLLKSDGRPMYNFACAVDDHRMGISHVLRGEDGISNTPRQLLIYEALGWQAPLFGHLAFVLGPDGKKLSKRHGDTGVLAFRDKGYLSEALLNYLGLLGLGGEGEGAEVFGLQDLVQRFDADRLVKKASVFDLGKLDFLNAHWLRTKSGAELARLAAPWLSGLAVPSAAWLEQALETFKGNAVRLPDLRQPLEQALGADAPSAGTLAAMRVFPEPASSVRAAAEALQPWPASEEAFKAALKAGQVKSGLKGKDFFMPLRLALTGSEHGPELPRLLTLLGSQRTQSRLQAALSAL